MNKIKIIALISALSTTVGYTAQEPFNEKHREQITQAMAIKAKVQLDTPRKALVYYKASGFRHGSIPTINVCLDIMGKETGAFTADFSDQPEDFTAEKLKNYDLLIFNNTTKLQKAFQTPESRNAILDFIKNGGGFVAIHGATDAGHPEWPEYVELVGGVFDGHPWNFKGTYGISIEDPQHCCVDHYPQTTFKISDELYKYKEYDRTNQRVLMTVDTRVSPANNERRDNDHALTWVKKFGQGHVFISAFGHNDHLCWDPDMLQLWLNGIQFAAGDLKGETDALPQPQWQIQK
jgi:type 1 glutamine amidotransferase